VAGETRRQRRDARRATGGGPAEARVHGGEAAAVEGPVPTHVPTRRLTFVRESWGELKKVEWPNRGQVTQGTIVVIIACAVVGAFLWGADQVLRPLVRDLLLGL
jgi:preprotein translocase SecE subunit